MPDQKPNRVKVNCYYCRKTYYRSNRRVNESKKFGWKSFCSIICQSLSRSSGVIKVCSNANCNNIFYRTLSDIRKTKLSFCSSSCAAKTHNFLRIPKPKKKCILCNNDLKYGNKYCSSKCQAQGLSTTKDQIVKSIQNFYFINKRIPLKVEMGNYKSARLRFGTWNKAIIAAGYKPNPELFGPGVSMPYQIPIPPVPSRRVIPLSGISPMFKGA